MSAKYVLGIDLGTTNSVLAYGPLDAEQPQVERAADSAARGGRDGRVADHAALVSLPGASARRRQAGLSICLGPRAATLPSASLPGGKAAEVPDRTVAAAKSWLAIAAWIAISRSCPGTRRRRCPRSRRSRASQRYLEHLVAAWEAAFPDAPVAEQLVVLTVPASFDASARELTREAALAAGLPEDLVLLEEPQAAVYAWLADRGDRWRRALKVGDTLLVCDVGGGTTDLTLVGVAEEEGELVLRRIAVGNHLLVGGDNMDLALAHHVAGRFAEKGVKLDPWQSVALWHSCRTAKEALLGRRRPGSASIRSPSSAAAAG